MNNIIQSQFTILGPKGSGKTSYLLGAYNKLSAGVKGFAFYTDPDANAILRRNFETLYDKDLSTERFPQGTNSIETYLFTMTYAFDPIMDFYWIDYPGELLKQKENRDINTHKDLTKNIVNSQVLFICLDGNLFRNYDNNDVKISLIKKECSSVVNSFFSRYFKINKYLPPIGILISKSDLCNKEFTNSDYEVIIKESFSPLFTLYDDDDINHFVTIIPVSLGEEISINNYTGDISTRNVETPIFMASWFTLKSSLYLLEKKHIQLTDTISTTDREKYIKKINYHLENLNGILNDNIKFVYYNGNKCLSFQDAAEKYINCMINTNES